MLQARRLGLSMVCCAVLWYKRGERGGSKSKAGMKNRCCTFTRQQRHSSIDQQDCMYVYIDFEERTVKNTMSIHLSGVNDSAAVEISHVIVAAEKGDLAASTLALHFSPRAFLQRVRCKLLRSTFENAWN